MAEIFDLDSYISNYWNGAGYATPPYIVDNSGVSVSLLDFSYLPPPPAPAVPVVLLSTDYFNQTSVTDTETFQTSKSTTATFQWALTEGIKIGAKAAFEVDVPVIGGAKVEVSTELNFSATETQTASETQTWTWNVTVPVPASSHIHLDAIVSTLIYKPNFTAHISLSGNSEAYLPDRSRAGGASIGYIVQGQTGFQVSPDLSSAVYTATGTFKGVLGIESTVKTQEL
ncbi:MAG TPA: ETX/MTX2 family pore-forming toxin [Streptosporangiaceae bacterium]|nr:ETX/MTX2 family pore-forming toxin [Streptosporangiaceae bacterium]